MPVLFKDFLPDGSIVGVWQVTESVEELYDKTKLTADEEMTLETYKHENRKKLWLSYRALIHDIVDDHFKVSYTDFGKPFLELIKKNKHVSISHSGEYSAVIINDHMTVGIDIEKPANRIERVAARFLSESELGFIDKYNSNNHLTICWAAKEALFKIHGNVCFDFKEQIVIEPFNYADSGVINCTILREDDRSRYMVYYRKINEYYLAHVSS